MLQTDIWFFKPALQGGIQSVFAINSNRILLVGTGWSKPTVFRQEILEHSDVVKQNNTHVFMFDEAEVDLFVYD